MKFSLYFKILFCTALVFCFPFDAKALSLLPTRQTLVIDPHTTQVATITLTNDEKEPLRIKGEVNAFRIDEKTHRAVFDVHDEAEQWITIEPHFVDILPGETKDISFRITVPQAVPAQVHYLGLFASVAAAKGQVGVGSRVGSLLFLYTGGNLQEESHVVDFSAGSDWYSSSNAQLFLQIQNSGNVHVLPQGGVVVKNWRGKTLGTFVLNEESKFLFPNTVLKKTWSVALSAQDIGKLTARLQYVYGVNKHVEVKEIYFWYVPWWSIGMVLGVFLFGTTLITIGFVHFFKRKK